jgi:hypothetical protein
MITWGTVIGQKRGGRVVVNQESALMNHDLHVDNYMYINIYIYYIVLVNVICTMIYDDI